MRFSPGKVPTFGDFSQDFIRCKVRRDFIKFRFQVEISFGLDEKNNKKITKYWHLTQVKKNYLFASHLKDVSLKMGGTRGNKPLAKSLDSGAQWIEVNPSDVNDPPTPFHKPWLLPQTTLHAHARRTFCTSVCKPRLTPSNLSLIHI